MVRESNAYNDKYIINSHDFGMCYLSNQIFVKLHKKKTKAVFNFPKNDIQMGIPPISIKFFITIQ